MKSIHFPQLEAPRKTNGIKTTVHEAQEVAPKLSANVIDALRDASSDLTTITHEFHRIILSDNRHGALIVIRGACIRFLKALEVMIKAEEQ